MLLDEPSEGVQRENVEHMIALIKARQTAGTAFVLVEQNLAFAEAVVTRYLVLDQGRAVLAGERDAVTREAIVAHLGV